MLNFLKQFFQKHKPAKYQFRALYESLEMYPVRSEKLYIQALTHSSYTKKLDERNERLEFLGDAVINFAVAESLYHLLPGKDEGTLTKARATIVNRKKLNSIGIAIGLPGLLRHKLNARQLTEAPDIMGNAFEALIGAYFMEYGMHDTQNLVGRLLLKDFDPHTYDQFIFDNKSFLIEWAQAQRKQVQFSHAGSGQAVGIFEATLLLDGEEISKGTGRNKKDAEQEACKVAVQLLGLE
jgi:ribonuclease III